MFFLFGCARSQVEHHDNEDKKHHDGASVNDDFKRCHKWSPEHIEHYCYSEQRYDQVEQSVYNIQAAYHQDSRHDGHSTREVKS